MVHASNPDGSSLPEGVFFAPAAERNAEPILSHLRSLLTRLRGAHDDGGARLLEVASGSGQHASAMAPILSGEGLLSQWQATDADARGVVSCEARRAATGCGALAPARELNALAWPAWVGEGWDAVLAVNVLHISPEGVVEGLCRGAASALRQRGLLIIYGPFMLHGAPTTPSNAAFHATMVALGFGLKDVSQVAQSAAAAGFGDVERFDMPSNNMLLVFEKK